MRTHLLKAEIKVLVELPASTPKAAREYLEDLIRQTATPRSCAVVRSRHTDGREALAKFGIWRIHHAA